MNSKTTIKINCQVLNAHIDRNELQMQYLVYSHLYMFISTQHINKHDKSNDISTLLMQWSGNPHF